MRAVLMMVACASLAVLTASCQVYQRSPIDLTSHSASVASRLTQVEPIGDFLERLRGSGATVPEEYDVADGLSFAEGEVLALFHNPDVRLLRRQAGIALADFETAGLWEDPEFGFDAAELLSPSGPFEYGLTLGLTIPISGRLGLSKERAATAYEAERRRIVDAEWSLRFRVRQAWVDWTAALERDRLAREMVTQVERILTITDVLEASGDLSRIETRLFRVDIANRRTALLATGLDVERARLRVLELMGVAPDIPVDLLPAIELPTTEMIDNPVTRLIDANTQLATLRADYETAEATLSLEVRKQYPDIKLGPGFGSEDNDSRFLLGLSVPIPILNANKGGIAKALASRDAARAEVEALLEHLVHDLAHADKAHESARLQRERFETEIIPLLQEQLDETEDVARLGEVNSLVLLETLSMQTEAKARLLDLRLAEAAASLRVTELLGPDSEAKPAPVGTREARGEDHIQTDFEGEEGRP